MASSKEQLAAPKDFFADFDSRKGLPFIRILLGALAVSILGSLYLSKPAIESLLKKADTAQNYSPVSREIKSMNLEINNPEDELFSLDKTIVVSGKSSPKAWVVIANGDNFVGLQAGDGGEFSTVLNLQSGINQIQIFAFDSKGNSKKQQRMVYFSEEKI